MTNPKPRGRFIPFRKSDLVAMCLEAGLVARPHKADFEEFRGILEALLHFEYHRLLESLKNAYAPFNPDADTRDIRSPDPEQRRQEQKRFVREMRTLLNAANFEPVTPTDLQEALAEESLFKNLDNNAGVFHHLIDAAEEEEFKEARLAYLFLAQDETGLTRPQLDATVEGWLAKDWDCTIDFEVDDALAKLMRWGLVQNRNDCLVALPLSEAKACLDRLWDNFFTYQDARTS